MAIADWIRDHTARNRERLLAQGWEQGYSLGYNDGYSDSQRGKPPQQPSSKAGKSGDTNRIGCPAC